MLLWLKAPTLMKKIQWREIDQRNHHNEDLAVDIPILDISLEREETKISEGILVIQKNFKKLIPDEEEGNMLVNHQLKRAKEYDNVMVIFIKKIPTEMYNKMKRTNYGSFMIVVVVYVEKNLKYNKLQPSNYGCPFKPDVICYPD